jgi:hypothetical protein
MAELRDRYPGIERAVQRTLIPGDAQGVSLRSFQ